MLGLLEFHPVLGGQAAVKGHPHGDETGQPADGVGDGLGPEDAGGAHPPLGQQDGQGGHDHRLAQQREEDGPLGAPQGGKAGLAHKLEGHEEEAEEILFQGHLAGLQHGGVTGEDGYQQMGHGDDQRPGQDGVARAQQGGEPDALPHPAVALGAEVVAQHRLGTAGDAVDRQGQNLPHRVQDGHDADVQIAAPDPQGGVAHHLYQAVGGGHDEAGHSQPQDIPHQGQLEPQVFFADAADALAPCKEQQHPDHGGQLADDGGDGGPLDPHPETEDEHRVQHQVQSRPQQGGAHPHPGVALGADESVEAGGQHGAGGAQQVDFQVGVGVAVGGVAGAEEIQHRPPEQIAHPHQHQGADKEQCHHLAQNPLGPLVILGSPGDGEQGRAAVAVEIGKGRDQGGQGEGQPDAGEGHGPHVGQVADVDPVHHIVQQLDQLGHRQGHRLGHNAAPDLSFCKITGVFCFHPLWVPFLPQCYSYCSTGRGWVQMGPPRRHLGGPQNPPAP